MVESLELLEEQATAEIPSDDSELIASREKMFKEAEKAMEKQRERWRKNDKLYNNTTQVDVPMGSTMVQIAIPLSTISTELAIISDFLPTFDVMPEDKNDVYFADMMQKRKAQVESKNDLKKYQIDCIKDNLRLSNGILRVLPRLNQDNNFTGLNIDVIDLYTWFPDPNATGMDLGKNCRYHVFAAPVHTDEVKRQYKKEVKPEGILSDYRTFEHVSDNADNAKDRNMVLVKECYTLDENEKKYPFGRVTIWANNVLLDDKPLWEGAEVGDDGYEPPIPYFEIGNYKTAHSMFGIGETELLRTIKKALDETVSSLGENVKKTSNQQRKVKKSWVEQRTHKIKNVAGEEIVVNTPDDVMWEVPPNVPVSTFRYIELLLRLSDITTNVVNMNLDKLPKGVTAASAVAQLQEAAQAVVRFKLDNDIAPWVKRIGKYIIWLFKNYDRETISIRNKTETGEYEFINYDPTGTYDMNGNPADHEEFNGETAGTLLDSKLDIDVVTGVNVKSGRYQTEAMAIEKFEKGIYGIEKVVEKLAESDKKGVIEGYYKRQGLEQAVEKQEALNKAFKEFSRLVEKVLKSNETGENVIGTTEEMEMERIITQFPELLNTGEWKVLPEEYKERLLEGFKGGAE